MVVVDQYLDAQVELAEAAEDGRLSDSQRGDVLEILRTTPEAVVRDRRNRHSFERDEVGPMLRELFAAYERERS